MFSRLRFLLLLPVATLLACGGASSPPTGTSYTPVAGDYVITVGVGTAGQANFNGDLVVNNTSVCPVSSVCGVFLYNGASACTGGQPISFTGSFSSNVLTLTSASFSGSVATLSITLPLSNNNLGQQLAGGNSVITGGTCSLASSTLQAQLIPSYTGTWSATVSGPSAATATLQVIQSTTANADGEFPATGVLTFNPTGCTSAAPDNTYTGVVSGASLQLKSSQYNVSVTANNAVTPATVTIGGDINGGGSSCMTAFTGTMTD
ncbi:MAG: hypothetical protein ABSG84_14635 [Acidobacteriaceae bacterium]|jgi:hypothetical protein